MADDERARTQIIQMSGAPVYCRRNHDVGGAGHIITACNPIAKTFTIAGDQTSQLNAGQIIQVTLSGGGTNDGYYTVVSAVFGAATVITVSEAIPGTPVPLGTLWINFDKYDSQTNKLPIIEGENQTMWEDTNSQMYFGWDHDTARGFGVILAVFGDYGNFTWEYYDGVGAVWKAFTPFYDNTENFGKPGLIVWGALDDAAAAWGLFTVNNQSAYWVRATPASVTTAATFYNLLRGITCDRPIVMGPEFRVPRYYHDIDGDVQKTELPKLTPTHLTINCTSIALKMQGLNSIFDWHKNRRKLWIIDLAKTSPVDYDEDAFYPVFIGYMEKYSKEAYSPEKMAADEYVLEFIIDSAVDAVGAIESTTWELIGEAEWGWVVDDGTDALDGAGGIGFPSGLDTT